MATLSNAVTGSSDAHDPSDAPSLDGRTVRAIVGASRALFAGELPAALRLVLEPIVHDGHASWARAALAGDAGVPVTVSVTGGAEADGATPLSVPLVIGNGPRGLLTAMPRRDNPAGVPQLATLLQVTGTLVAGELAARWVRQTDQERLAAENARLRRELQGRYTPGEIIGGGAMRDIGERVAQVAGTSTPVLLRGEPGSGRTLLARTIHYNSPRALRPFVRIGCASLPAAAIDAELFGRDGRGAGDASRAAVELAEGGTLFIDEIAALPGRVQAKLLRLLREREYEQAGGESAKRANVRLVVATAVDLEQALAEGRFRQDLYDRLTVFSIAIPPLRDRRSDIPALVAAFADRAARDLGRHVVRVSPRALDTLAAYRWPGNVQELHDVVAAAVGRSDDGVVDSRHLPPSLQRGEAVASGLSLGDAIDAYEKDLLEDALRSARGVRSKAARLLRTTDRIFNYKLRKHGIECGRFKGHA